MLRLIENNAEFRKKREKYEGFLKSVSIFSSIDEYEMTKIMDAVKPIEYKTGSQIIKEVSLNISSIL